MRSRSRKSDTRGTAAEGATPAPAEQGAAAPADGSASALLRQTAQARSSRRHMMARAGTVVAGTVAGLTLLDQRRAEASNGANFLLGTTNNADATTKLVPTTTGDLATPLFKVDGTNLTSTSTTAEFDASQGGTGLVVNASSLGNTRTGLAIGVTSSGKANGIIANSGSGTGVSGSSTSGTGVSGSSTSGRGVSGGSGSGTGVFAASTSGTGVRGTGARGGDFSGKAAAIRLRPASGSHPSNGSTGDVFVDNLGHLWYCRVGGSAATWVKLA